MAIDQVEIFNEKCHFYKNYRYFQSAKINTPMVILLSTIIEYLRCSCLPVLTGIVSVTAAGFVLGPTSVPCLLASLPKNNRKELLPLEKSPEVFWFGLSFLTKAIDSLASG